MSIKKAKKPESKQTILISKFPLRLNQEQRTLVDRIRKESARLWNDALDLHWWLYDTYHVWTNASEKKKWFNAKTHKLHAQTIQAILELHEETCKRTFKQRKKGNKDWKYPWRYKGFFSVKYKKSAISVLEDGKYLKFSNGAKEEALGIPRPKHIAYARIKSAEIVWHKNQYWLHLALEQAPKPKVLGSGTAAGDLGEIHAITLSNGQMHMIITGREIRSLQRWRNKTLRKFSQLIDRKKKGSNARYKLILRKRRFLEKMQRKIEYIEHAISRQVIDWCIENHITALYLGNPDGVQTNTKKKKKLSRKEVRQKLSNWAFGELIRKISYKGKLHGISVEKVDESYTSGTCPSCGAYRKQLSRIFSCACGVKGHRDVVAAVNILDKTVNGSFTKGRALPQYEKTIYRQVKLKPILGPCRKEYPKIGFQQAVA